MKARKVQRIEYFSPHPGLTFDFVKGRVIGRNGEVELTHTQHHLLYRLAQAATDGSLGGYCSWKELEKQLPLRFRIVKNGNYKSKEKIERDPNERMKRVQQAVSPLRVKIKKAHPSCVVIPPWDISVNEGSYRLTTAEECTYAFGK